MSALIWLNELNQLNNPSSLGYGATRAPGKLQRPMCLVKILASLGFTIQISQKRYHVSPGALRLLSMNYPVKETKISPCTLRLLTPALSSFSEEREQAGALSTVLEFNARIIRRILSSFAAKREEAGATCTVQGFDARI